MRGWPCRSANLDQQRIGRPLRHVDDHAIADLDVREKCGLGHGTECFIGMAMLWPAIGCDIRMFHIRPIEPAGGRNRKNT